MDWQLVVSYFTVKSTDIFFYIVEAKINTAIDAKLGLMCKVSDPNDIYSIAITFLTLFFNFSSAVFEENVKVLS